MQCSWISWCPALGFWVALYKFGNYDYDYWEIILDGRACKWLTLQVYDGMFRMLECKIGVLEFKSPSKLHCVSSLLVHPIASASINEHISCMLVYSFGRRSGCKHKTRMYAETDEIWSHNIFPHRCLLGSPLHCLNCKFCIFHINFLSSLFIVHGLCAIVDKKCWNAWGRSLRER